MISAILVKTQTHRQLLTGHTISLASWAERLTKKISWNGICIAYSSRTWQSLSGSYHRAILVTNWHFRGTDFTQTSSIIHTSPTDRPNEITVSHLSFHTFFAFIRQYLYIRLHAV